MIARTMRQQIYVGGVWRAPTGIAAADVRSAASDEVIGRIPLATAEDAGAAVVAARVAQPGWAALDTAVRLQHLEQIEKKLEERTDELARLIASEVGTPLKIAPMLQVTAPISALSNYRALMADFPLSESIGDSVVLREPVGVVVAITAWNFPLQQVLQKVGAALATGSTVVVKPSEIAPLSAFVLADVVHELGLPPGVFNLVSGLGPDVGEALVLHPGVDMVTFTGSTPAGRRIGEIAAGTVKKVTLELGGKSASVVLDDADLEKAVKVTVANCFTNSGQTCTALTRLLVPRARLDEVEELVRGRLSRYRVGDPLDPDTSMGPLATKAQQERVRDYIELGIAEGARLVAGGPEAPEGHLKGNYVVPTAFSDVRIDMRIAREEIFGPVLVLMPYETEDEAVEIANATDYGLAGAVWSGDVDRAWRVAGRLRTGSVDINGSYFNPLAPFGGHKQSGVGRELGKHGLAEYFEFKSVQGASTVS